MKALGTICVGSIILFTACCRKDDSKLSGDNLPSTGWPSEWRGITTLACGDMGDHEFCLVTEGVPGANHLENYKQILSRWDSVWADAKDIIESYASDYDEDLVLARDLPKDNAELQIVIPSELIVSETKWEVCLAVRNTPTLVTMWHATFRGWKLDPTVSGSRLISNEAQRTSRAESDKQEVLTPAPHSTGDRVP